MKKLILVSVLAVLAISCSDNLQLPEDLACDNGTFVAPNGYLQLNTQQEVDDFGAMCYTKISGVLTIGNIADQNNDIIDLSPLIDLKEINQGYLKINAWNLENLDGLNNLTIIDNGLWIIYCANLINLDGLENLTSIGATTGNLVDFPFYIFSIQDSINIESIEGLHNLTYVGGLSIGRTKLQSLNGLESLNTVSTNGNGSGDGVVYIGGVDFEVSFGNGLLTDLCALQNLFTNGEYDTDKIEISANAYNPTVQDIIDGNCAQ